MTIMYNKPRATITHIRVWMLFQNFDLVREKCETVETAGWKIYKTELTSRTVGNWTFLQTFQETLVPIRRSNRHICFLSINVCVDYVDLFRNNPRDFSPFKLWWRSCRGMCRKFRFVGRCPRTSRRRTSPSRRQRRLHRYQYMSPRPPWGTIGLF